MMSEYTMRLVCLCLASFFVVQLAAGAAVRLAVPYAARVFRRIRPRLAARALLLLRWIPAAMGLFAVGALCVPSYLRFEPGDTDEEIGLACLIGAGLALAIWIGALVQGLRQVLRSRRCIRNFESGGRPLVALAGILRTRLLISPAVVDALPGEQLDAALCHERAHEAAHDNLKRFLLAFTPGLLPGINGLAAVERQWARFTEWAADDDAVAGDADRALALASALVRVARLGSASVPLASSLLDGDDLSERVGRLLYPAVPEPARRSGSVLAAGAATAGIAALAGLALRPATLESAHELLEHLVR